jgi:hypothetical protein
MLGLTKRLHARILQGSTSEVYGERPEGYRRLGNMAGLRACYDEGKRCAKTLFYDCGRQHGRRYGCPHPQYLWAQSASAGWVRRFQIHRAGSED